MKFTNVQSHQIWDGIHKYMFTHINAKFRELIYELKSISKGEKSIFEHLARIQRIINILDSINDLVSHHDQFEAILDDLHDEYNVLACIISGHLVLISGMLHLEVLTTMLQDLPCLLLKDNPGLISHLTGDTLANSSNQQWYPDSGATQQLRFSSWWC